MLKLTKSFLRELILEELKNINEATEQEIGYLEDVLDMPISALPFGNIFGDRYRILTSFQSAEEDSDYTRFESFLNRTGWAYDQNDMGYVTKAITSSYIANPDDGLQKRTKEERLSLIKWMQELDKYLSGFAGLASQWTELTKNMEKYSKDTFKRHPREPVAGFKREHLKDQKYLNMFRRRLSIEKAIEKFITQENVMTVYSGFARVTFSDDKEKTLSDLDALFNIESLKRQAARYFQWLNSSVGGSSEKQYEFLSGKTYDEFKNSQSNTEYVIFSRHPIDVFRMSDHVGLQSCHTVPSSRMKLGASPSEPIWDQYNICALSEAHANGMIAYVVNPEQFEELGGQPTQEFVDQYEDEELFYDDERGIDGLKPEARVRVKNVAVLDGNDVISRLAVPDRRTYGDTVPGFREHMMKFLANAQQDKISDVLDKKTISGNQINLDSFMRVGGSYQDGGSDMSDVLPEFLSQASGKNLDFRGRVQYSFDLQDSIKNVVGEDIDSIEVVRDDLREMARGVQSGFVSFFNLGADREWDGTQFFMTGQVRVYYPYGNSIYNLGERFNVRQEIEDAISQFEEVFFYDNDWFTNYDVSFEASWGGYSNVMIIDFPIGNVSEEHVEFYNPYDRNTWQSALEMINSHFSRIMEVQHDDNFQNSILDYLSYWGASKGFSSDRSEKFIITRFKNTIEEDRNWSVDEVQTDEDSMNFETVESFTAEYSGSADLNTVMSYVLGENFDEDNETHVNAARNISALIENICKLVSSEGMNVIKSGLLSTTFLKHGFHGVANILSAVNMTVENSIGWGGVDNPDSNRIFQGIIDNDDIEFMIQITIDDSISTTALGILESAMLGNISEEENTGWHIDQEETLHKMIMAITDNSDLYNLVTSQSSTEPANLQEFVKREVRMFLNRR